MAKTSAVFLETWKDFKAAECQKVPGLEWKALHFKKVAEWCSNVQFAERSNSILISVGDKQLDKLVRRTLSSCTSVH
jgi:hypothetical protein